MDMRREKVVVYIVCVILLITGVVCYAAFPKGQPEEPVRILFKSAQGKVLFSHKVHSAADGYGYYCIDCHHLWDEDEESSPVSCSECHMSESDDEYMPRRSDALHRQCQGCHEEGAAGPSECSGCHVQ